jgi:hypothetical protein
MKKVAALAVLAMVALATAQPAVAGVGGCYGKIGVGGCWALTDSGRQETKNTPSVLDSLNGALPADVVAFLKMMFQPTPDGPVVADEPAPTTQGVGGCFGKIGVGGCAL